MIYALVGFAALMGVYAVVWTYLIGGQIQEQKAAIADFVTAWDTGDYEVALKGSSMSPKDKYLRIEFNSGNSNRYVNVDSNGLLLSNIRWGDSRNEDTKPSARCRAALEEYTQQIAVMFKLENDLSTSDFNGDGGDEAMAGMA